MHPHFCQWPDYGTENSTIFCCSQHCGCTFRALLILFKENLSFTCFWMFVYIQRSFLHHADCPKSDSSVNGEPQGALEVEFKLLRCDCKLSLLFVPHSRSLPESFLSGLGWCRGLDTLEIEEITSYQSQIQWYCFIILSKYISKFLSNLTFS